MKGKKPILITLAVFASILLLVVATALIMHGRGAATFQNEDAPYPYRWTEKKNGTVLLVLDNAETENWTAESTGDDVVTVSPAGNSGRGTAFLISPTGEGRTELIFTLCRGEDLLAKTVLEAETLEKNGKRGVTVTHHSERTLQSVMNGGEETEHPFTVSSDGYGGVVIHITDSEISAQEEDQASAVPAGDLTNVGQPESQAENGSAEEQLDAAEKNTNATEEQPDTGYEGLETGGEIPDAELPYPEPERWTAESSDSLIVNVRTLQTTEGGIDVFLSPNINGSTEVTVASEQANFAYVFTVVSENGSLRLTDSKWTEYEQQPLMADDAMNALLAEIRNTMAGMETESTP